MKIPQHISESLETIFGLKYLIFLMRMRIRDSYDPGSGMEKTRIRDKHPRIRSTDNFLKVKTKSDFSLQFNSVSDEKII